MNTKNRDSVKISIGLRRLVLTSFLILILFGINAHAISVGRLVVRDMHYKEIPGFICYPFTTSLGLTRLNLEVLFKDQTSNSFFITISKGQSQSYDRVAVNPNQQPLIYHLLSDTAARSIVKEVADVFTKQDALYREVYNEDASHSFKLPFYLDFPKSQSLVPGVYSDRIQISLYLGSPTDSSTARLLDMAEIQLTFLVSRSMQFNLSQSEIDLNYGYLEADTQFNYSCDLKSNVEYQISVDSEYKTVRISEENQLSVPRRFDLVINNQKVKRLKGQFEEFAPPAATLMNSFQVSRLKLAEKVRLPVVIQYEFSDI